MTKNLSINTLRLILQKMDVKKKLSLKDLSTKADINRETLNVYLKFLLDKKYVKKFMFKTGWIKCKYSVTALGLRFFKML